MHIVLSVEDRQVAVTRAETVMGRAPDCDVVLLDKSVSRVHAAIVLSASGPALRDLGSRNGTWVNGLRLGSDRRLRTGDHVRLGSAAVTVLEVLGEPADRDDGWLAVQATLLLRASSAGRSREADEILFRLAEAIEAQLSLGAPFSDDVSDAALAAVVDYATVRARPGWVRWVLGVHGKLGAPIGPAVRRSLESAGAEDALCASGTLPVARIATTGAGRRAG